jgi:dihydrofolate reductase
MTTANPKIAMIAAVPTNFVIGANGGMPWYLPSDFKFFKATTMGKPMIMGRKQFETVGKPLSGRTNIVVTRQQNYQPDGVIVINDFEAALSHAKTIALADKVDEIMIIGGGEIYKLGLPFADRLYITHIDAAPEGDTVFPQFGDEWVETDRPEVVRHEKDTAQYYISIYEKR